MRYLWETPSCLVIGIPTYHQIMTRLDADYERHDISLQPREVSTRCGFTQILDQVWSKYSPHLSKPHGTRRLVPLEPTLLDASLEGFDLQEANNSINKKENKREGKKWKFRPTPTHSPTFKILVKCPPIYIP